LARYLKNPVFFEQASYLLAQSIRGTTFPRKFVQIENTYEDGRDI